MLLDGAQVVLDRSPHGLAAERLDHLAHVRGVNVHRHPFGPVADLLARNHDELPALFDERPKFIERLQAILEHRGATALLNPRRPETVKILLQRSFAAASLYVGGANPPHS